MELRKETLEADIQRLQKDRKKCELAIERNNAVSQDIADENMAQYYENQVATLTERKFKVDEIAVTDQGQAVDYQKKLHGFEKLYFDKLLEAVKNQ